MFSRVPRLARLAVSFVAVAVLGLASSQTYSIVNEAAASHGDACYLGAECIVFVCDGAQACTSGIPTTCGKNNENGGFDRQHGFLCGNKLVFDGLDCTIPDGGCGGYLCLPCTTCPRT